MRSKLGCFIFLMVIMTTLIFSGTVYYVDASNGNDYNDGISPENAWQTISKINGQSFFPGDFILFKRGEEWREQLMITSSGSRGNHITFGAYGTSDAPIINGSVLIRGWSEKFGYDNVYQTTLTSEPLCVWFDGTFGKKQTSIDNVDSEYDWYWKSKVLYIYSISDPDTAYHNPGIEGSSMARDYCIFANNEDYITIENIQTRKANFGNVYIAYGSSHWIIDNVTSSYSYRHGIMLGGSLLTDVIIRNSTFSYNGSNGISGCMCSAVEIRNNEIHHNSQLGQIEHNYSGGIYFGTVSIENILVENNTFHDNGNTSITTLVHGAGVWFDGDSLGATDGFQSNEIPSIVRYNKFYNNKTGIKFEHTSYCQAYYNLIYDCIDSNSKIGDGTGIYLVKNCHHNKIYNNVSYGNRINIALRGNYPKQADNMNNNLVKNNICDYAHTGTGGDTHELATTFGAENDGTYGNGNVYEYNCFGTEYSGFIEWGNNQDKDTYDAWEKAYGSSTHSVEPDSLMTDPANDDFTLQDNSPCINLGINLGLAQDYAGNTVPYGGSIDIGAYEYIASGPLDTEINASPTSGWIPLIVDFTGSASGGTEPYKYSWDFGDSESSSEQNPLHTYSIASDYTVTLTVTDSDDNQDTDSLIINASTKTDPLQAAITPSPISGEAPLTVSFNGNANGGTSPYSYSWDFGDGGSSSAQNPSHTYTNAGTHNVTLTVTDAQSSNASDSITITAYSISSYQLAVSAATGSPAPGTGGTTDPSPGIYSYSYGNSVQVEAIPNESYRFSKWTGDVSDSEAYNGEVNITMDKDKSISAFFCTKCGDVTGDLSITPADSQAAFEIFLGIISNPTESEKENADVDCSGTKTEPDITPGDAQAIFEKFLGINDLPCDCSCNSRSGSVLTQMRLTQMKQTQDINIIINDIRVDQGGEVVVPIIVDNPFNIKAFGFDLIFPSESLEFVGVERTEPLDDFYQIDTIKIADGVVRAGGYRSKPIMSHSPKALITLIFKVIGEEEGLCSFSIVNTTDDIENAYFKNEKIIKRIWKPRNIHEKNVRIR